MKKVLIRSALALAGTVFLLIILFALNGLVFADNEQGRRRGQVETTKSQERENPDEIRLMAFNIAKCFMMEDRFTFASKELVLARLEGMAEVIRKENPDVVCLSETIRECGPCNVDQVRVLAEKTGLKHWAFGENYSFGLPFYRIVGGNAILSRHALEPLANPSLQGRQPFWVTKNNRRALACQLLFPKRTLKVWSIHNDSFDLTNNLAQMKQILAHESSRGAFLAGDFNAQPDSKPMKALWDSERFSGQLEGAPTFPAAEPIRRIDFAFAPKDWEVVEHRIIPNNVSDHCAVLTVFRPQE